jgi:valyl-tRNA synthetase
MRRDYPESDPALIDDAVLAELDWVKQFIMGVRQIRSEMDIKPGRPLPVICRRLPGSMPQRKRPNPRPRWSAKCSC